MKIYQLFSVHTLLEKSENATTTNGRNTKLSAKFGVNHIILEQS